MDYTIEELAKLLKVHQDDLEEFYESYTELKTKLEGNEDAIKQAIRTLSPFIDLFYPVDRQYNYLILGNI